MACSQSDHRQRWLDLLARCAKFLHFVIGIPGSVRLQLVRCDQHRAERVGAVLSLRRAEVERHLFHLEVPRRTDPPANHSGKRREGPSWCPEARLKIVGTDTLEVERALLAGELVVAEHVRVWFTVLAHDLDPILAAAR